MTFVARHDIHLVTFDLAFQNRRLLTIQESLTKMGRHLLSLGGRQIQLDGDLPIREVQPHEIGTQHPNLERLMMPREHRVRQIVETPLALAAPVSLTMRFGRIVSVLDDLKRFTMRTTHPLRPA